MLFYDGMFMFLFFLQVHDSAPAGPKIVLVPLRSNFNIYVCPHLEDHMPFIHVVLEE